MKLLTLNTHSLIEPDYENKLNKTVESIARIRPDIIALQEVSQTADQEILGEEDLQGFFPVSDLDYEVRANNHAARFAASLRNSGANYYWTWIPIKIGYGIYDEGVALFSLSLIVDVDAFRISHCSDYQYWKTRKVLGIRTIDSPDWYYSVHFGWWDDEEEPFKDQWHRLTEHLGERCCRKSSDMSGTISDGNIILMGDFNSPSQVRGQGYDMICQEGWYDAYELAKEKDNGLTVVDKIDGWKERIPEGEELIGLRMDLILSKQKLAVSSSHVVFDGQNEPVVSDHYGVIADIL